MIYLDTSAFIKLYLREEGTEFVNQLVMSQDQPLPVWELLEVEFFNAFQLKVFWKELTEEQIRRPLALFDERKRRGLYQVPAMDRVGLLQCARALTRETPRHGCRSLDILHVACAQQLAATLFVTFDHRQRGLAETAGLATAAI